MCFIKVKKMNEKLKNNWQICGKKINNVLKTIKRYWFYTISLFIYCLVISICAMIIYPNATLIINVIITLAGFSLFKFILNKWSKIHKKFHIFFTTWGAVVLLLWWEKVMELINNLLAYKKKTSIVALTKNEWK